ncbi:hypothetical protein BGZ68_000708 [Mortierella alpina]|nr:hypothetical protein BGZ68_000708 [Mortierella alpina]
MYATSLAAIALLSSAVLVSALPSCNSGCGSDRSILESCQDLTLSWSVNPDTALKVPLLNANCQDDFEDLHATSIDLDEILANILGKFAWGKNHFSRTASNIQLDSQTAELSASLLTNERDAKGVEKTNLAKVNLAERIRNDDGQLKFFSS